MCTYNGERFLREQLQSIARQTMAPRELIVCDDGSCDATLEIVSAFAEEVPFRVRVVRNGANLGSTRNFEQAIGLCSEELIALSDQDDWWSPAKLEHLAGVLQGEGVGGVFSDGMLMDENSRQTGETLWKNFGFDPSNWGFDQYWRRDAATSKLLKRNVVTGATLMFRSSLRSAILPFPMEWIHDGWQAWMLVLHSRLQALAEPLIRYRIHRAQQAGVTGRSFAETLRISRNTGAREYRKTARQYEILMTYANAHPEVCGPELCQRIREKCRHLEFRAKLYETASGKLHRALEILPETRGYRLYAEGWKSMLKDWL